MFFGNPDYAFIKGDIKNFDTCMEACEGIELLSPYAVSKLADEG